jgi:protein ImuA
MQMLEVKSERLRALLDGQSRTRKREVFSSGLDALDEVAPFRGFRFGGIHELLFGQFERDVEKSVELSKFPHLPSPPPVYRERGQEEYRRRGKQKKESTPSPKFLGMILARAAQGASHGAIVWSDPRRELNPTAILLAGIDLGRVILLRPRNSVQEISALAECLRCRGVSAVVAQLGRLSDIEARRLQLAAECGGGIGIFLRPMTKAAARNYAAATRWLVCPALEGEAQCWTIQLLHGHGGRLGSSVLLEVDRETGDVRAFQKLSDRPAATPTQRATA